MIIEIISCYRVVKEIYKNILKKEGKNKWKTVLKIIKTISVVVDFFLEINAVCIYVQC